MIRRDWWLDVVPAAIVTAGAVLGAIHIEPEAGGNPADVGNYVVIGIAGLALLARRRWPVVTLVVVTAALVAHTLRQYPGGPIYLAGPVALYSLAVARPRLVGYVAAALVTAAVAAARLVAEGPSLLDLLFVGWAAIAVLAAEAMRARHDRVRHHRDELLRRLAEDRLQVARDLHDSVAHSMATINVQSGVAAHVLERHPEQATAALEAIRVASRDVLDELGAMLALLRDDAPAGRHPTPDLSVLGDLASTAALAGVTVDVRCSGELATISPAVSTAAYRIVQEALTNVARHASTDHATVTVTRQDGVLDVEVVDDGAAGDGRVAGTGMGLVGIHERVEATGGHVEVGPRPGRGWRVAASWPVRS